MRILVVDDQREIRLLLVALLASYGHEVIAARSPSHAIEVLKPLKMILDVDVVITDLHMGAVDGYNFARFLRAANFKKKIILYSSDPQPRWLPSQIDAYCEKGNFDKLKRLLGIEDDWPMDRSCE